MSTSILYHGWGLTQHNYLRTEFSLGTLWFHAEKKQKFRRCPECKSKNFAMAGQKIRVWRTLPIGQKPVNVVGHLHRIACHDCGELRWEDFGIADEKKRYTRSLGRHALGLSREMSISAAARRTELSWPTVKDIVKEDLKRRAKKITLRHLKYIAIDEISERKGHKYFTVVMDWETGDVLHVAEGRGKECLKEFFQKLRYSGAKLRAVATDMHDPYLKAVKEYYRKPVEIVFDHFHVMKLVNEAVDEVRRQEVRIAELAGHKQYLKGLRFLLLKPAEDIDGRGMERLEKALQMNENICKAYILKEDIRNFWEAPTREEGVQRLVTWIQQALCTGLRPMLKLVKTLVSRWQGLVAYFDHPISTGPLEGLNTLIKMVKRRAFGYRDREFFKLRILFIHECTATIAGV